MWKDRFKSLIGGAAAPASAHNPGPSAGGKSPSGQGPVADPPVWPKGFPSEETTRHSRGLQHFLAALEGRRGSAVLDLGGASQANITYITSLGHRMSSESVLHALDSVWHDDNLSEARKIEDFLEQTLNYQYSTFAGVLLWDTLQFLPPPILQAAVLRLYDVLEQDAVMLAYFHADEKQPATPSYSYRIVDGQNITITPKTLRTRPQALNSRAIENLFGSFRTVKFFLTRDHLREVLIVR